MNSFGRLYKISTFGESHGIAIGGVIDGIPSGITLDFEWIQAQLDRRKPGQSAIVTQRKEPDTVQFLSGIFTNISKVFFVHHMQIIHTKLNMAFATIEVEEELLRAKLQIG